MMKQDCSFDSCQMSALVSTLSYGREFVSEEELERFINWCLDLQISATILDGLLSDHIVARWDSEAKDWILWARDVFDQKRNNDLMRR